MVHGIPLENEFAVYYSTCIHRAIRSITVHMYRDRTFYRALLAGCRRREHDLRGAYLRLSPLKMTHPERPDKQKKKIIIEKISVGHRHRVIITLLYL